MTKRAASSQVNINWSERGSQAIDEGDLNTAKHCFMQATKAEKNVASHRFHLALVLEALGDFGGSAEQLSTALRLKPDMFEASRRLGSLIARHPLPAGVELDELGLKSALRNDLVNRDQIAEAGVYYLARREPLKNALERGREQGWIEAARNLVLKKTDAVLKVDLLIEALRHNLIRMPELEYLLTAIRRVILLEVPVDRFADKALLGFTVALAQQCWINEFVWSVTNEEAQAAKAKSDQVSAALAGDVSAGFELLKASLYQPLPSLIPSTTPPERLKDIKPHMVRDFVVTSMGDFQDETTRAAAIPDLTPVKDATSQKVSAQYSEYPYPRWSSLGLLLRAGEWRKLMGQYFDADALAFMDKPFEVLIAGCGTGLQAIAAAHAYGPNAKVTAIDISKPSLAYASRMAEYFHATNISFALADIKDLATVPAFKERFDVIECVGVLHHMADPMGGWRSLQACCAPHGKMLIGLYSDIARRKWTAMRSDPAYPGAGCDDDALRHFRQDLLKRPDAELGAEFKGIRDLYSTSSFRDLMLHISEQRHSIPEIAGFLKENDLAFRGFMNVQDFERLKESFPDEVWPGSLDAWAKFENAHPLTFASMYRLWCERS